VFFLHMISQFFHSRLLCVQCGCGVVVALAAMVAEELEARLLRVVEKQNEWPFKSDGE
jgi:hypothetical protein